MIVYQATNRINGKRYIGATTKSLTHRRTGHWHDANGRNYCRVFGAALRKYGRDGFDWTILVRCSSKEEMSREEIRLIAELKPEYNITIGGQGIFGVPYTEERRAKLSKSLTGKKLSPERRKQAIQQLALQRQKRQRPVVCLNDGNFFLSCQLAADFYGMQQKNVYVVAIGEQAKSKGLTFAFSKEPLSREECSKLMEAAFARRDANVKRYRAARRKPVICLTDGEEYPSAKEAGVAYGLEYSTLQSLCRSGGTSVSGHKFAFVGAAPVVRPPMTEEAKQRHRDGLRRAILKRSKRVICEDTGAVYDSISAAARAVGRSVESVSASIRRNGKCGGMTFKFEASIRGVETPS